ncbi:unnamed protein product [Gadus morhua 'NCC']
MKNATCGCGHTGGPGQRPRGPIPHAHRTPARHHDDRCTSERRSGRTLMSVPALPWGRAGRRTLRMGRVEECVGARRALLRSSVAGGFPTGGTRPSAEMGALIILPYASPQRPSRLAAVLNQRTSRLPVSPVPPPGPPVLSQCPQSLHLDHQSLSQCPQSSTWTTSPLPVSPVLHQDHQSSPSVPSPPLGPPVLSQCPLVRLQVQAEGGEPVPHKVVSLGPEVAPGPWGGSSVDRITATI